MENRAQRHSLCPSDRERDDGEADLNPVWLPTKMATRPYRALPACSVLFFSIPLSLPSLTAATAASAPLVPWVSRPLKKGNVYFLKEKKKERMVGIGRPRVNGCVLNSYYAQVLCKCRGRDILAVRAQDERLREARRTKG